MDTELHYLEWMKRNYGHPTIVHASGRLCVDWRWAEWGSVFICVTSIDRVGSETALDCEFVAMVPNKARGDGDGSRLRSRD